MDGNKKKNVHWNYDLLQIQLNLINMKVYFFPIYKENIYMNVLYSIDIMSLIPYGQSEPPLERQPETH